ncbi:MAG TPA: hypothetical protein VK162_13890 [Streptosporangiaceae bacterium]|nr:hypothetical protein [Streptosporangiaceae bacterium]
MTTTPPDPDDSGLAEASVAAELSDLVGGAAAAAAAIAAGGAAAGGTAAGGMAATAGPQDSGPPEPIESSVDPVRLLVHAVGQLPSEQRDLVLTWLLRQRPGLSRQWTLGARASEHAAELHALQLSATGQQGRGMAPTAHQVVPVRFPAQQHAQLREWCAEHGFSMATVIRGLVARFLESQLPDRN